MSSWYWRNREKALAYQKAYNAIYHEKYTEYYKIYYNEVLKPIRTVPPERKKRQPKPPKEPKPPKQPTPPKVKKEKVWKDKTIRKSGRDYETPAIIIREGNYTVSFN